MNMLLSIVGALVLVVVGLVLYTAGIARRMQALAPPLGDYLEVDGARLHYLDRGSGPAIVMVHGLGGNLRNFYRLFDRLAEQHRVIAIDRPGSGYSTMLAGAQPDLPGQAALIARCMDALGLEQPLLVGHSLGGALALAFALDHPGRIRGLALVAPLSQPVREPPPVFKVLAIHSPALRRLLAWTLVVPLGKLNQEATVKAVFHPEPPPADFAIDGGGVLGLRPGSFIAASQDLLAVSAELERMVMRYPSLDLPVDIIYGRQDAILDYRVHGERLAAVIPGARLHLIDGGHMIPITAPETVAERIRQSAARGVGAAV